MEIYEYMNYALYGSITLIVITILLLILFRFSFYKALHWMGIGSIISSCLFLVIKISSNSIPDILKDDFEDLYDFYYIISDNISNKFLIMGILLLGIGILFIILSRVLRNSKKLNKEVENI